MSTFPSWSNESNFEKKRRMLHLVFIINVKLSKLLLLLLDHQAAWERLRKGWGCEEKEEKERIGGMTVGWRGDGAYFCGGSLPVSCQLSSFSCTTWDRACHTPTLLPVSAVATTDMIVVVCLFVFMCVEKCKWAFVLCWAQKVMRCTHMHASPSYRAVELWLPQHLID